MEETKLTIISSEEILAKFNDVKQKIEALDANCKAIIIIDQESCERAVDLATLANKISKLVDERRALVKKPYLESGALIDTTAKSIIGELNKTIVMMKEKIKAFDDALKAKKAQGEKELTEKLQAQKALSNTNLEDLHKAKDFVDNVIDELIEKLNKKPATDIIDNIVGKFPKPTTFGTAIEIVRNFRNLILELRETLLRQLGGSVEGKKAYAKKFNELVNFSAASFEKAEEHIKAEAKVDVIETITKMTDLESVSSGASTRTKWVYEVTKFDQIPLQFLMVDDAAVKAFMKENEDKETKTIKGEILGITFKQESTVVLR